MLRTQFTDTLTLLESVSDEMSLHRYAPAKWTIRQVHVLTYFVAHEGHHRGQIVLRARQLGDRLPADISGGLWQWNKRLWETT